ncbi:MAG: A24 family peptidase, partial [Gammaproteobacteria bacterium]|nr:A24 family peptidase [Gammaproteobacteria bacterium]
PGSHCPKCLTPLKPRDLVPLASWALARGCCRYCGARIDAMYPLVEAALAAFACVLVFIFGFGFEALAGLVFALCLLALSVIDARTLRLPDVLTLGLLWLGLLCNVMELFADLASAVIGAFAGYAVLWAVMHAHRIIRRIEGMGYGDFKLLAAIGAWTGWQDLPVVLLIASVTGLLWALQQFIRGRADFADEVPFAPFLSLGGVVALITDGGNLWPGS